MSVSYTWDLQAYISGAWTTIKRDVEIFKEPLTVRRGIKGGGITDRIAAPGSLVCSLDNGESNSGGLLGYYSPGHTNARANFGRDTNIRLKITYSATDYYKFHGYITDLDPEAGQFGERSSKLYATDYMNRLANQRLRLLAAQENQRPDQLVATLIAAMPTAPQNTTYATDTFYLPFALTGEQDERTTVMGALQKVVQSSLGYLFVKGNTTDGETLVYQREADRAALTSSATLNNTMTSMKVTRPLDKMFNRIIGKVHPTRVDDDADTLLAEIDSDIYVDAGDTKTFTFRFVDPLNQAVRISAKDIVTPLVADTHYRASQWENTTNSDANANITITDTYGANSAEWQVENTGGFRVFINLVNIFGRGIYYYNPVTLIKESGDADRETTFDFYYLADQIRGTEFLNRLHTRTTASSAEIESVAFYADENSTLMGYAMTLDIGSRVTVQEASTGLNGQYTINNVSYTIEPSGALLVEWGLEPADTTQYFILNSSLLNGAHVLSPY